MNKSTDVSKVGWMMDEWQTAQSLIRCCLYDTNNDNNETADTHYKYRYVKCIFFIVLGFNNMSILVGHFVSL